MEVVRSLQKIFSDYNGQFAYKKKYLHYAAGTTRFELTHQLESLIQNRDLKGSLKLLLKLANSSIWLSRSSFQLLSSLFLLKNEKLKIPQSQHDEIVSGVLNSKNVNYDDETIFKSIYFEVVQSNLLNKENRFKFKKDNLTIVLVSGVLNEIFSTPAFSRGAENLHKEFGINFFSANVSGTKSSKDNADRIHDQLAQWASNNPNEKVLFVCYSKGGIDLLHYFKKYRDELPKQIIGAHFMASPILGSDNTNALALKLANSISKIPEKIISTITEEDVDIFARQLQKSISKDFRSNWFEKNHKLLPKNIFYSSIAFESEWHNSHIYMMATKALFQSNKKNDGVVDVENAKFPTYFKGINLGVLKGHHLISSRSSLYDQEALMSSLIVFLNYKKLL